MTMLRYGSCSLRLCGTEVKLPKKALILWKAKQSCRWQPWKSLDTEMQLFMHPDNWSRDSISICDNLSHLGQGHLKGPPALLPARLCSLKVSENFQSKIDTSRFPALLARMHFPKLHWKLYLMPYSEQLAQDGIMLSKAGVRTLFHALHVGFRFVAHSRADGGVNWNCQIRAVSHAIRNAAKVLTFLWLDAVRIKISNGAESKSLWGFIFGALLFPHLVVLMQSGSFVSQYVGQPSGMM